MVFLSSAGFKKKKKSLSVCHFGLENNTFWCPKPPYMSACCLCFVSGDDAVHMNHLCALWLTIFTAGTGHCRKGTGVINNSNYGCIQLMLPATGHDSSLAWLPQWNWAIVYVFSSTWFFWLWQVWSICSERFPMTTVIISAITFLNCGGTVVEDNGPWTSMMCWND